MSYFLNHLKFIEIRNIPKHHHMTHEVVKKQKNTFHID